MNAGDEEEKSSSLLADASPLGFVGEVVERGFDQSYLRTGHPPERMHPLRQLRESLRRAT